MRRVSAATARTSQRAHPASFLHLLPNSSPQARKAVKMALEHIHDRPFQQPYYLTAASPRTCSSAFMTLTSR